MNMCQFIGEHWLISLILACPTFFICVIVLVLLENVLTVLPKRWMRHRNIMKHGWPPTNCDADGDPIAKTNVIPMERRE